MHNYTFKYGSASHELYESSGCNPDWAKAIANINHTYVIELKPKEISMRNPYIGFDYPEEKLAQAGQEMYDGMIEYFKTFFIKKIDKQIIVECEKYQTIMYENLQESSETSY